MNMVIRILCKLLYSCFTTDTACKCLCSFLNARRCTGNCSIIPVMYYCLCTDCYVEFHDRINVFSIQCITNINNIITCFKLIKVCIIRPCFVFDKLFHGNIFISLAKHIFIPADILTLCLITCLGIVKASC